MKRSPFVFSLDRLYWLLGATFATSGRVVRTLAAPIVRGFSPNWTLNPRHDRRGRPMADDLRFLVDHAREAEARAEAAA